MSTHNHAVSVSCCRLLPAPQFGVHQSAGHPDQADAETRGGGGEYCGSVGSTRTPCGSPGLTSWSGPTVAGGTDPGSFGFGVMSSGGRIARVNSRAIPHDPTRNPGQPLVIASSLPLEGGCNAKKTR